MIPQTIYKVFPRTVVNALVFHTLNKYLLRGDQAICPACGELFIKKQDRNVFCNSHSCGPFYHGLKNGFLYKLGDIPNYKKLAKLGVKWKL